MIKIFKSKTKLGEAVQLVFQITQHLPPGGRDKQLMNNLISYFKAGKCYNRDQVVDFRVTKFENLTNIIGLFFIKYPIVGVKAKDFEDFKQVVELMNNKAHLTTEGFQKIKQIKMRMNRERE